MPGVADVAVVGKPHDVLGEVPVAFLVPGPNGFDPERLFAICRERLSYFKVPEELYEIARVPRTASGKITRHVLLSQPARLRAASSTHYDSLFRLDWIPLPSVPQPAITAPRWAVIGDDRVAVEEALRANGLTVDGANAEIAVLADTPPDEHADVVDAVTDLSLRLEEWLLQSEADGRRLVVLTRGAVAAGGAGEVPVPSRAALSGVARSWQAAHPGRVVLVDVDDLPASMAALPSAVSSGEPELAVRAGIVLRPRFARVAAEPDQADGLDPRRTVLVTGADRPAGAAAARQLVAAHGVRHVLLTSPRGSEDRATVDLAGELARSGTKVAVAACDPADRSALAGVLGKLKRRLTAVVHTDTRGSLKSIVDGLWNLHELTAELDLAAFVLYTSAVEQLGSAGRDEQAAASAVAGALVRRRRAAGRTGLALAWGPLDGADGADGTAPRPAGIGTLADRDAMAMFDAAQAVDQPVLLALRLDVRHLSASAVPPLLRNLVDAPAAPAAVADPPQEPPLARPGPTGLEVLRHPVLDAMIGVAGGDQVLFTGRLCAETGSAAAVADALRHAGSQLGLPTLTELAVTAPLGRSEAELQILVSTGTGCARVFTRPSGAQHWVEHGTALLSVAVAC